MRKEKNVMSLILEGLHKVEESGVAKSSKELEDFMFNKARKGMKFTFMRDYRYGPVYNDDGYEISKKDGEEKYKLKCVYFDKRSNSCEWAIPKGTTATFVGVEGGPGGGVVLNINGLDVSFIYFTEDGETMYLSSKDFPKDLLEEKVLCLKCGSGDIVIEKDGTYYCKECKLRFTDEDLKGCK